MRPRHCHRFRMVLFQDSSLWKCFHRAQSEMLYVCKGHLEVTHSWFRFHRSVLIQFWLREVNTSSVTLLLLFHLHINDSRNARYSRESQSTCLWAINQSLCHFYRLDLSHYCNGATQKQLFCHAQNYSLLKALHLSRCIRACAKRDCKAFLEMVLSCKIHIFHFTLVSIDHKRSR